jgi:hypothetical protein
MTYEEMKAECDALVALMLYKGVETPKATIEIASNQDGHVALWCDLDKKQLDGKYLRVIRGETPQEQIAEARAYIATLPDPATEGARKFTRALADAVDIATEYSLPDAAVAPVRAAIREVNAVLLEGPK